LYDKIEWFKAADDEMAIDLTKTPETSDGFVLVNLDAAGYFRVNYEPENWKRIIQQLDTKPEEIKDEMKAQLIHDSFALSQAGYVDADLPLRLTKFLSQNADYLPWNSLLKRFGFYEDMLTTTRLWPDMGKKMSELVETVYTFLGLTNLDSKHSWVQRRMRADVIDFACRQGLADCVTEANTRFVAWKNDPNSQAGFAE